MNGPRFLPSGNRISFGDYWKLGLLCVLWFSVVVILVAPMLWKF
jgi:di/tricarboxylate transporter